MKFKVFYKPQDRYLTEYELQENYVGKVIEIFEEDQYESWETQYLFSFRVNLSTGMIQTGQDNSCSDSDCCTKCKMFVDDDDFEIHLVRNVGIIWCIDDE